MFLCVKISPAQGEGGRKGGGERNTENRGGERDRNDEPTQNQTTSKTQTREIYYIYTTESPPRPRQRERAVLWGKKRGTYIYIYITTRVYNLYSNIYI